MFKKKSLITLVSLLAILCVTVGGTIAFLTTKTDPVVNEFKPSEVTTKVEETIDGNTKKDVKIKNTGDTTAYIRAAVVVTWQDKDGNVYGQLPVKDNDYTITLGSGWKLGADGFYYYTSPVKSVEEDKTNCYTGVLITSCTAVAGEAPADYYLTVEIIGSGIQNKPASAFNGAWGESSGLTVKENTTDPATWTLELRR